MPFAIGAALAIIGGPIGLFCRSLAHSLALYERGHALVRAIGMTLHPIALIPAMAVALPFTTLLLPAVYYLTRSRLDVTPLRYAIVGAVLAIGLVLPSLPGGAFGVPRVDPSLLIQQMRFLSHGMNVGTVLAGVVFGSLFGCLGLGGLQLYMVVRSRNV